MNEEEEISQGEEVKIVIAKLKDGKAGIKFRMCEDIGGGGGDREMG